MTETTKNRLGIALIIGILTISYAVIRFVGAYGNSIEPGSFRSFSVSADGKAVAIPDIATFSFGVITEGGNDLGAIQKENTTKVNDTISFLKTNGVLEKDVKTENYSIQPKYSSCPRNAAKCPPPEIIGYTINQNVLVKIRNFATTGTILAGIVENGANSVSNLDFTLDDPTAAETQTRTEALKKARLKAEEIAKAGGFRIGRVLNVGEGYFAPFYRATAKGGLGFGGENLNAPTPVIEPGSEEIQVNVTVTYEIR